MGDGKESFFCEKFNCTLSKDACVKRQTKGQIHFGKPGRIKVCSECERGKVIKGEIDGKEKSREKKQERVSPGSDSIERRG